MIRNILFSISLLFSFAIAPSALRAEELSPRHIMLIEEFTSEFCNSCPMLANNLQTLLESDKYKGRIVAVAHHAGFTPDWLTTSFDADYEWFYNSKYGSTYAPAVMLDRRASESNRSPVKSPANLSDFTDLIEAAFLCETHASLSIAGSVDADNPNLVHINAEALKDDAFDFSNPVITVWVVENNIPAVMQYGARDGFTHQHVNRDVNATFGAPVVFSGDKASYSCDFILNDAWDKENIQFVASLGNYNSENPKDCLIENSAVAAYADFNESSGIAVIDTEQPTVAYFTLSGIPLAGRPTTPGIYIHRNNSSSRLIRL